MVGLLPIENICETENNVRNFLSEEFPRFIVKAGYSTVDIQSPKFSAIPHGTSVSNGVENNMIEHIDAPRIVNAVIDAINRCPEKYRKILKLCYVDQLSESAILARLNYERSTYYRLKALSLNWFADAFENTIDLHSYKKRD